MPVSFATTTGRPFEPVTVNITALTPSTVYVASFATMVGASNVGHRIEFTTDGSGNATISYVPNGRNGSLATTCYVTPKVTTAAATSTNTFTAV